VSWEWVREVEGVADLEEISPNHCIIRSAHNEDPRPALFKKTVDMGITLIELTVLSRETQTLFSSLTKEVTIK
jgi:hypothetical protein